MRIQQEETDLETKIDIGEANTSPSWLDEEQTIRDQEPRFESNGDMRSDPNETEGSDDAGYGRSESVEGILQRVGFDFGVEELSGDGEHRVGTVVVDGEADEEESHASAFCQVDEWL